MAITARRLVPACLLLATLLAACSELEALPKGSVRFDPPAEYRLWWSMTESCSLLRGSLADVDWSIVPNVDALPGTDGLNGEWFEQGNRIVIAGRAVTAGTLIRHEMLHALTRAGGHSRLEFLERCGGVVACIDECLSDAGRPPKPPAGTPIVPPDSIDVSLEINPAAPKAETFGGYFTLAIVAHNPATHSVVVELPPSGDVDASFAWEYSIGGVQAEYRGIFAKRIRK